MGFCDSNSIPWFIYSHRLARPGQNRMAVNAITLPLDQDLSDFVQYLQVHRVPIRVTAEGDQQVVWVPDEDVAAIVKDLYHRYQRGELPVADVSAGARPGRQFLTFVSSLLRYPLTLVLIAISIVAFPMTYGLPGQMFGDWLPALTLVGFIEDGTYLYFDTFEGTLQRGEYWRLITPMIIHFGWIHLVFNMLWLWEFGRRIEMRCGSVLLLLAVLLSSLAANLLQYQFSGPSLFGGMSGVVYGLLGYALVWSKLWPSQDMGMPNGIYIFMLAFLALGFTGAVDLLGFGSIANGAHLGGLVAGVIVGTIVTLVLRGKARSRLSE